MSTGDQSTAVVKFEDGQIIVLQSNTRFTVSEYRYNAKQVKDSNMLFQLVRGGLCFVTGVIGSTNRNAFKLNVGTATIGVRGTDGVVILDAITQAVSAAVSVGSFALQTPLGLTNIPTGSFYNVPPILPPTPTPTPTMTPTCVTPPCI